MKSVLSVHRPPEMHWVGNGFPVRSLFSYRDHGRALSPFLLFDYAGPAEFAPATAPRGVGEHPHRGFETVTIVYQGAVDHRDSAGNGGHLGPGDVQWMTAGSGILHQEFHSPEFTRRGGTLEMVQLWVNLRARDKQRAPRYQTLRDRDIPALALPDHAGVVRVIAGECQRHAGPARTFTPIDVWDLKLHAGGRTEFALPAGRPAALAVLTGSVQVNGEEDPVRDAELAILGPEGRGISLAAVADAAVLLLCGEPIMEPVVGHGPFVMNSEAEIAQAITDFNRGRFGHIAH